MTTFIATFADGHKITRSSKNGYGVAWRSSWTDDQGELCVVTGFAASQDKATPYRPAVAIAFSARDREAAASKNAEFIARSGYEVEFAPAIAA